MKKYLSEIKKELSIFELKTNEELSNEIEKLKKRGKVEGLENFPYIFDWPSKVNLVAFLNKSASDFLSIFLKSLYYL